MSCKARSENGDWGGPREVELTERDSPTAAQLRGIVEYAGDPAGTLGGTGFPIIGDLWLI